jgi:hypothetical protein
VRTYKGTGSGLRIEVITVWYNERFLAKFFLDHYSFADRIHLVLDADTDDDTPGIAGRYPNVRVEEITFPDKFDDLRKIARINSIYPGSTRLGIAADSDEFVFPLPYGTGMREALANEAEYDVVRARMWQVYRHRTDSDLDPGPSRRPAEAPRGTPT